MTDEGSILDEAYEATELEGPIVIALHEVSLILRESFLLHGYDLLRTLTTDGALKVVTGDKDVLVDDCTS